MLWTSVEAATLGLSVPGVEDQLPTLWDGVRGNLKEKGEKHWTETYGYCDSTFANIKKRPVHICLSECLHHSQKEIQISSHLLEFWNRPIWFWISTLLLTVCVMLGKLFKIIQ